MANLWITYAWADNSSRDVDFLAQELQSVGVTVKLDRWTLEVGRRLWEQIKNYIQSLSESDAWLIYATQNSLGSEPCREEFAYALDRALRTRSNTFPVIALFPSSVDAHLLPAALRIRLCVSLIDPQWKERIKAAVEGRSPAIPLASVQPFHLAHHRAPDGRYVIEVRPRAGVWAPFMAGVPTPEKDKVQPRILHGPAALVPTGGALFNSGQESQQEWHLCFASNEATPTSSYFIFCKELPTKLLFGVSHGVQFTLTLSSTSQ